MGACLGEAAVTFLSWLAPIVASFFPWPVLILVILFSRPVRNSMATFVSGFAALPRAITAINVAGLKINLDPTKAKELRAISSEVVYADFGSVIDHEVERLKIWEKFEKVIEEGLRPLIDTEQLTPEDPYSFRVTLHMPDTLEKDALYQLIEYFPSGPFPSARGRRKSIRFGAIGKAWRLQRSEYSPVVSTEREKLIEDWGMTGEEADQAGRGRQTFLAAILIDNSKIPLAVFYLDAKKARFLGQKSSEEISRVILEKSSSAKLTEALVKVRTKMQSQAATPTAA